MSTTIDLTGGQSAIPWDGLNTTYRMVNRLDFSLNPALATNIVEAVKVQANTHVTKVYVKVVTAEGSTATATVGVVGTPAGLIASANLNATAGTLTQSTISDTLANGVVFTADGTIDIVPAENLSHAVVDVIAVCEDLR